MQLVKRKVLATLLGGTLIGISSIAAADMPYSVDDELLAMNGEFEVGNGESHVIASHKKDEVYRICVNKSRQSVPLKVLYDGKEDTIANGCADFEAMKIKVEPAGHLSQDIVLLGKFERLGNQS